MIHSLGTAGGLSRTVGVGTVSSQRMIGTLRTSASPKDLFYISCLRHHGTRLFLPTGITPLVGEYSLDSRDMGAIGLEP